MRNVTDSLKEKELEFMKSKETEMLIFSCCGLGAVGFFLPTSLLHPEVHEGLISPEQPEKR